MSCKVCSGRGGADRHASGRAALGGVPAAPPRAGTPQQASHHAPGHLAGMRGPHSRGAHLLRRFRRLILFFFHCNTPKSPCEEGARLGSSEAAIMPGPAPCAAGNPP